MAKTYGGKESTGNQNYSSSAKRSWQKIGGPKPTWDAEYRASIDPGTYNEADYNAFAPFAAMAANGGYDLSGGTTFGGGGGGGGGYGYGGGGGGGGGGSAMTQAVFDAMVKALGMQGQPLNLPAFQGQNIAAFNAAPYTQAQQSLNQAVAADTRNVNTNAQNTTNALNTNYRNDYANAQVAPGATQAPVGRGLEGGAGGANQQAAADVNAQGANSQAAFSNLLNVLAANANQSQASRLNQVQMDKGSALNQIGAQNLGLGAGINQARTQGQTQWAQQDNERRYQNSLMAQQWQREQGMQNWQQQAQQRQTALQPILDLIASGGKLDMSALMKLIQGQTPA